MSKRQSGSYFRFQKFTVFHYMCAMKVGTDGVLLGAWVDVLFAKNALDIGTGTGLISLMMAQRNNQLRIDAIDIDNNAVMQARENISQCPFNNPIAVREIAIQDYSTDTKYDVIVSNPPFFNNSLKSPDKQRALARHTDTLLVEELITSASQLLSNNGRLSVIYPFDYKNKLKLLAPQHGLHITRITNVFPTPQSTAKRILVEMSKTEKELTENNLIIEEERHKYTDGFKELVKEFYLKV